MAVGGCNTVMKDEEMKEIVVLDDLLWEHSGHCQAGLESHQESTWRYMEGAKMGLFLLRV